MHSDAISPHPEGVVIEVWVVPGASRQGIDGLHDEAIRVRTTAPAEGGKANRAVESIVAKAVGGRHAEVLTGYGSRRKRVLVRGVDLETAQTTLGLQPES